MFRFVLAKEPVVGIRAALAAMIALLGLITGCGTEIDSRTLQHISAEVLAIPTVQKKAAKKAAKATAQPDEDPEIVTVEPGRGTVRGHVLSFPNRFQTEDGAYDLVVHFHGNTDAVEESYELAGIGAALVIINLGEGADLYERAFSDPSRMRALRRRVREKIRARGVPNPKLRRLALSAWSAGYGAVMRIIDQPEHRNALDAVLLFDGMHARYEPGTQAEPGGRPDLAAGDVAPFIRLGKRAADDELLFMITHSKIQPKNAKLASVRETADAVIDEVGVERTEVTGVVKPRMLKAVEGIYARRSMLELQATSVAIEGQLLIAEYDGRSPLHHVAHLLQMSQIGLPRLALRWKHHRD
jgi:hypothetical protein